MTKTNNIPSLRFPDFNPEWKTKKLGEIAKFYSGGTPLTSKKEYFGGEIPFIRSGEINSNKTEQFITDKGLKNSSAKMVSEGDILYALYGATSGEVGISKINGAINQAILCIKSAHNHYYIYSVLKSKKDIITKTFLQGGQGNLSADIVKNLSIDLPSIPEQAKIASFLTAVDDKLQALKKKKELLEQYKKGVMQQLFSQALRFKNDDGTNYSDWEKKRLGDVSLINMGQSPSSSSYNNVGDGFPLIQGNADIQNRLSSPRNWTTEMTKECQVGDLILTVRAPVGAIAKSVHNACIGRGVCSIRSNSKSVNEFIYQFLFDYESKWGRLEQGSTFTAVSGNEIRNLSIMIPSIEEQTKIANFLSAIDDKIAHCQSEVDGMERWKKGLLQQMFC